MAIKLIITRREVEESERSPNSINGSTRQKAINQPDNKYILIEVVLTSRFVDTVVM